LGREPNNMETISKRDLIWNLQCTIPRGLARELERATPPPPIKDGAEVYLIKEGAFGDGPGLVIPGGLRHRQEIAATRWSR
jgi:hypothetical protein